MPRSRAFLALLLAITWLSAAWHVDLESVGMLFAHHHHAHDEASAHEHAPVSTYDAHQDVVARDWVKEQGRLTPSGWLWLALVVAFAWALLAPRRSTALATPRRRRETDPPWIPRWHFQRRCAPVAVAPPAAA